MPILFVYPNNNREHAVAIWPVSGQTLPVGLIEEKHSYSFELREITNPNTAELYIDDEPLEALRSPDSSTARWKRTPEFYAGHITVCVKHSDGQSELELIVDPDLSKLTRTQFDSMVGDILADTTALFSLSGFRFGVAKGTGTDIPPLARLEFLRSRVAALEATVSDIARKPVRVLSGEEIVKPLAAARTVNARDVYRSFYKSRLQPAPPHFKIGMLEVSALPTRLTVGAKTASEDISENRAIKTCLQGWRSLLNSFSNMLADSVREGDDPPQMATRRRWSRRCRSLATRLSRLLDSSFFAELPDTFTPLRVSPIFRRVPQYRRFFSLYRDINLSFAQIQGDFLDMPLSRTFDLYELWVFLRICRAAAEHHGVDTSVSDFFTEDSELGVASLVPSPTLTLEGGLQLRFKRQYREYWRDAQHTGSFSRTMVPDMSVETAGAAGGPTMIIVLDAKYRIGDQLNDALASIHMYRDAIVRENSDEVRKIVLAAYLISPDFANASGSWRDADGSARLFHPEYRQKFRFGALTLKPGSSANDAREVLNRIIADATRIEPPVELSGASVESETPELT